MAKFVELLLTALQYQAEGMLTMVDFLLTSLDPEESRRHFYRIPTEERHWFKTNWAETYRNRQQFYKALNQLKHQGLVTKKNTKGKSRWTLTKKGIKRAMEYQKLREDLFSSQSVDFSRPFGDVITIISYDISEKERRKRDWVRACLVMMGFEMLQKSVWVANGKVDEDFIYALRDRNLLEDVQIFAVTKRGTIYHEAV